MTQRHFVTRWLGALGMTLALAGLIGQGATSAQTPLTETRQRAEQGDAEAQYALGVMYATGDGVPEDDTQAVAWYRQAADQGHADAQYALGVMYRNGEGVPQDDAAAVAWHEAARRSLEREVEDDLRQAADQGNAEAQYTLGGMYLNGEGVPQDFPQAAVWYRAVSTSVRQPVSEFTEAPPRARSGKGPGRREAVAVCL